MRLLRILEALLIGGLTVTLAQAADLVDEEVLSSPDERTMSPAHTSVALSRDQAVDQALAQNPGFLALKRQVDLAYAQREQADGFESPKIYWEFEEANRSNASGISSQVIGIEQSIEWFGVRSARKQLADIGIEATRALVERGRLRLTARILKAYDRVLLTGKASIENFYVE